MQIVRFYIVVYRAVGTYYPWKPFCETEYTEKEANREIRQLNQAAKRNGSPFVFRKKFIYSAPMQTLSVR